jgi:PKD domain
MKPRVFGSRLQIVSMLALMMVSCEQPSPPNPTGGPSFTINSPLENSSIGGTSFFSVQAETPSLVTSVSFKAGSNDLGTDNTVLDGFKVFLNAKDYPAGALTLEAKVTGIDGKINTKTISVQNIPIPPSSTTVTNQGAVLGTTETNGALSTLTIPPGVADGATVSFTSKTQAEVKASTGVDYDALGVTFLGAQEITSSTPLDVPLGLTSGGFAPKVQPGQAIVNFRIAPDADGDGKGELVAINTASTAPNGDVISDPIPRVTLGAVQTTSRNGSVTTRQVKSGLQGQPGNILEIETSGFNTYSLLGNVAVFRSLVDGSQIEMPGVANTDEKNTAKQIFSVVVPVLPPGGVKLVLENRSSLVKSKEIDLTIIAGLSLTKPPSEIIDNFFLNIIDFVKSNQDKGSIAATITALEQNRQIFGRLKNNPSPDAQQLLTQYATLIEGSGILDPQTRSTRERCFTSSDRRKFKIATVLVTSYLGLLALVPGLGTPFGVAAIIVGGLLTLAEIDIPDCPPPPPQVCVPTASAGSGGFGLNNASARAALPPPVVGAGSAPPPGGNGCGNVSGGGFGAARSQEIRQIRSLFAPEPGRYVVKIYTNNNPGPFTGVSDAGGYFFVPFIPTGQPFTAIAIDRKNGQKRNFQGTGPSFGKSVTMFFDFSSQNSAPVADAGSNQSVAVNTSVTLNASTSSDPEFDPLTYAWVLTTKPASSNATLTTPNAVNSSFTTDVAGEYIATVTVSDGSLTSSDTVKISATSSNRAPVADAGINQSVTTDATVTLNGNGSSDPDGNVLTYQWVLTTKPSGSIAALSSLTTTSTSFIADKTGQYQASLTVSDGSLTNTNTVTITATGFKQAFWDGDGDGIYWDDPKNWVGDVLPQTGDSVTIDVPGTPTIIYRKDTTLIQSLDCKETLTMTFGVLEIAQTSTITNLNLQNGILRGLGNLSIDTMNWDAGILGGDPGTTATVNMSLTMSGGERTLDTRQLINKGSATLASNGSNQTINDGLLSLSNNAILTNNVGATFTTNHVGGYPGSTILSGTELSRIYNAGTMTFDISPCSFGCGASGLVRIAVAVTNTGTLNINTGRLLLKPKTQFPPTAVVDLELDGIINITDRASLVLDSGRNNLSGSFNGIGKAKLEFSGGTSALTTGAVYDVPYTSLTGGTLNSNTGSKVSFPNLTLDFNVNTNALAGALGGTDNFSFSNLDWYTGTISGAVGTSATLTGTGKFNASSPYAFRNLIDRQFTNAGTVRVTGAGLYLTGNANFTNAVGASYTDTHVGKQTVFSYVGIPTGRVINAGTMTFNPTADVGGKRSSDLKTLFTNTGILNVGAGIISVFAEDNPATVNTELGGTINLATGGVLRLVNGTTNLSGVISGTGTAQLEVAGGTVNLPGTGSYSLPTTTITTGIFNASGTITGNLVANGGTLNVGLSSIGNLNITGNYTQGATASLKVDLNTGGQKDNLSVSGTSSLSGILNINRLNNFIPTVGESFQVITAGSVNGTFSSVQTPGLAFLTSYSATSVTLTAP